jgi:hypothetical protein
MSAPPDRRDSEQDAGSFLSRWSRRKSAARQGQMLAEPPAVHPVAHTATTGQPTASAATALKPTPTNPAARPLGPATATSPAAPLPTSAHPATEAPPTLADVAGLDPKTSDFSRFVARSVDSTVRNAALKKLFSDPHFNVMDGLDIYIDDYGQPDPLPPGMLEQLRHTDLLGLQTPEPDAAPASAVATTAATAAAPPEPAVAPEPPEAAADPAPATGAEPPSALTGLPDTPR